MVDAKCFVIERTGRSRYVLRRYHSSSDGKCPGPMGYHNAHSEVIAETEDDPTKDYLCSNPPEVAKDDPRWQQKCDACDFRFTDADPKQVFGDPVYRRLDTGEILMLEDAPPGALWRATWYENRGSVQCHWTGDDGQSWMCRLPDGHDWFIDGKCSNCTRPNEPHHCWVRKGVAPNFTVGKDGDTCAAGAGSIMTPNWHGFLTNGELARC